MKREDIYLQAMRGVDGQINVGYLVLFRAGSATIAICFALLLMGVYGIFIEHANTAAIIESTGKGIGVVLGGFALTLGAVGAFLWGDSKQMPPVPSTTIATQSVETKVP